jgi:hypothetical protein
MVNEAALSFCFKFPKGKQFKFTRFVTNERKKKPPLFPPQWKNKGETTHVQRSHGS